MKINNKHDFIKLLDEALAEARPRSYKVINSFDFILYKIDRTHGEGILLIKINDKGVLVEEPSVDSIKLNYKFRQPFDLSKIKENKTVILGLRQDGYIIN